MLPGTFNAQLSIFKFLRTILTNHFNTPTYWNTPLRSAEEEAIKTQSHYLRIAITPQKAETLQILDTSLYLHATRAFDPSAMWIRHTPDAITQCAIQTKTRQALNLIAVYDYDQALGSTALDTFLKTGVLPDDLAETWDSDALPYYTVCDQEIGMQVYDSSAVIVNFMSTPMIATWRLTFRYFEPKQMMGAVTFP